MAHIKIAFVHYPSYSTKTYNKISGKDTHTVIKKKKNKKPLELTQIFGALFCC